VDASSILHKLHRNWLDPRQASHAEGRELIVSEANSRSYSALQRWHDEDMREQPYHNLDSVVLIAERNEREEVPPGGK